MPTKRDKQMQVKCYALAYHFANGIRAVDPLAEVLQVRGEQVRRWGKRPEFHEGLDNLDFTGDRQFTRKRRDVERENPQAYQTAILLYDQLTETGVPKHKRIREIAKLLDNQYSVQRIKAWINRHQREKQR